MLEQLAPILATLQAHVGFHGAPRLLQKLLLAGPLRRRARQVTGLLSQCQVGGRLGRGARILRVGGFLGLGTQFLLNFCFVLQLEVLLVQDDLVQGEEPLLFDRIVVAEEPVAALVCLEL